jgi:hypothetical protein
MHCPTSNGLQEIIVKFEQYIIVWLNTCFPVVSDTPHVYDGLQDTETNVNTYENFDVDTCEYTDTSASRNG